jgi:propionate CoA-transferase
MIEKMALGKRWRGLKKVMTPEEAVQMIHSGDTISVCGISAALTPDKVLAALGNRFLKTGSPRDLTMVFPLAVGDAYEIKGMDHLAHEGMIKRLIGGSYTVARSSEQPPKIYEMIVHNQVEAYNFPSGILMQLHREIAAKRPGLITEVGLGTFVDPRQEGGKMNDTTQEDLVEIIGLHEKEYLFFPSLLINIALIRGTTADEDGNITMEHEYSTSFVLALAMAARNSGGKVIAQVKRLAARGTMHPQLVKVPGMLVDTIVVDEHQKLTTGIDHDPSASGELRIPWETLEPGSLDIMKQILVRRILRELRSGDVVNLGFGITALIPQVALEEGVFDQLTFTTEHGAIGGFPYSGIQFGGALNPQALIEATSQFDFIDGGGPDVVCLSFAEVDREGNVNVTKLRELPHVLAGAGGFIDLIQNARKIIFCGTLTAGGLKVDISEGRVKIVKEGKTQKFVERVQQITFNGQSARKKAQDVIFVTERGVFDLDPDGLVLREIAPGLDVERDILSQIGFKLKVAHDLKEMDHTIFQSEPMGLKQTDQWRQ